MRCSSLGYLSTALLFTSVLAFPQQGIVGLNELFGRQVSCNGGQLCGYSSQLCCASNACYTDASNQAQCKTYLTTATAAAAAATTGYWTVATSTYTTNGQYTVTSTYTTYIAAATTATSASISCNVNVGQEACGEICCASTQYCAGTSLGVGTCSALNGASTGYANSYYSYASVTTDTAGVPLRPTSSTLVTVTASSSTTTTTSAAGTTEPFQTPVTTSANITVVSTEASSSSGLSGGAIAGIVIGVLLALFILGLICFYCCLKGLLDGCFALFGLGRRRKEVDIYERRTHHSSGGGGAVGRTWYGAPRPARDNRRNSEAKNFLGIGVGLAALWAILGLKRRNERRRNEEKQSEYSYYSSDYYTSESSASSDRRTRDDRRSRR